MTDVAGPPVPPVRFSSLPIRGEKVAAAVTDRSGLVIDRNMVRGFRSGPWGKLINVFLHDLVPCQCRYTLLTCRFRRSSSLDRRENGNMGHPQPVRKLHKSPEAPQLWAPLGQI